MKIECPACGAAGAIVMEDSDVVRVPFGENVTHRHKYTHCDSCKEECCLDSELDREFEQAHWEAKVKSIPNMLDELEKAGVSVVSIERVMEIPFGTLKQWKDGGATPEGIALLRVIRACPAILEFMDSDMERWPER